MRVMFTATRCHTYTKDTAHMGGVRMLSLKRSRVSTTWQDTAATRISVSNRTTSNEDVDRSAAAILLAASSQSGRESARRGSFTAVVNEIGPPLRCLLLSIAP